MVRIIDSFDLFCSMRLRHPNHTHHSLYRYYQYILKMRFHKAILPGWPSRFLHHSNDASRSRSSSSTRMVVTTTRWWHWKVWMGILYSIQIFVIPSQLYSVLGKVPEASSTFLRMHRMYSQQPPHDTRLYDILQVTPNATLAQIQKSYRKLTKQLHPDKQRQHQLQQQQSSNTPNDKLQQVRQAYEVLKEDSTRLPYHRYGLLDVNHAAFLLTGAPTGEISTKEDQLSLLRLMGYDRIQSNHSQLPSSTSTSHQQRVFYIAANLLERMRPLVEGAISNTVLADSIAQECDRLKTLPLGAQIIRCIGRAYRHSGQRVLRKHQRKHHNNNNNKKRRDLFLPDLVRDQMRGAKQVLTAAAAGGRFVLTEQMTKARFSPPKQHLLSLECSALGEVRFCVVL